MSMALGPATIRYLEVLVLAVDSQVLQNHPKGPPVSMGLLHKLIELRVLVELVF